MVQLFRCNTVYQRKIMEWLAEQGLTPEDIAAVEMFDLNKVKITNPAGQYMVLVCDDNYRVGVDETVVLQLTANKTKMIQLAKAKGYEPPRNAQFTKAFRSRTWWLEWFDASGSYQATLSTAGGKAFFGMRYRDDLDSSEQWESWTLSMGELQQYSLLETKIQEHSAPDYEPEL